MLEEEEPETYVPPAAQQRSLLRRRAASFGHALRGVWVALRSELHLQFHAAATVLVLGLGAYFQLSPTEWALVGLSVASVWAAELFNTAIETLTNLVSPGYHPLAGKAKDVAAGAVLLAALGAVVVGGLVFGPKVWALLPR
ncbi:diacylglycerol kinase family protein [Hymenobacter setariae]|uniref:Diacylglycerol kinase family protein n=1 Tax=Hymenobacter setariae TaxID=2594794 RepID=A0A558BXZ6_9BACT|nr:diacylglycerol kinase family protein [Hymenobacter setariae]TVT41333.1 diacylglycerol kinase family protein [Hymenobacter setariae]